MRRLLSLIGIGLLMLAVTFSLVSCEQDENVEVEEPAETEQTEDKSGEEKVKIGFAMDTLEEERWIKDRDLFKESVEALGAEVMVMASNGDDALQIWHAETMLSQGIDLLVIVPHNAESTAAIVYFPRFLDTFSFSKLYRYIRSSLC